MENFTLKRVKSLRRSIIGALEKLEREGRRQEAGDRPFYLSLDIFIEKSGNKQNIKTATALLEKIGRGEKGSGKDRGREDYAVSKLDVERWLCALYDEGTLHRLFCDWLRLNKSKKGIFLWLLKDSFGLLI